MNLSLESLASFNPLLVKAVDKPKHGVTESLNSHGWMRSEGALDEGGGHSGGFAARGPRPGEGPGLRGRVLSKWFVVIEETYDHGKQV